MGRDARCCRGTVRREESSVLGPGGTTEFSRWRSGLAAAATGTIAAGLLPPRRVRWKNGGFTPPTRREAIDSPRPQRPCRFWHSSRAPGRGAGSLGGTNPAAAPARAGLPPAHLRQPSRLTPQRPGGNGQDSGSLRGGEGKHDVWRTRFMERSVFQKLDTLWDHEPGRRGD